MQLYFHFKKTLNNFFKVTSAGAFWKMRQLNLFLLSLLSFFFFFGLLFFNFSFSILSILLYLSLLFPTFFSVSYVFWTNSMIQSTKRKR